MKNIFAGLFFVLFAFFAFEAAAEETAYKTLFRNSTEEAVDVDIKIFSGGEYVSVYNFSVPPGGVYPGSQWNESANVNESGPGFGLVAGKYKICLTFYDLSGRKTGYLESDYELTREMIEKEEYIPLGKTVNNGNIIFFEIEP